MKTKMLLAVVLVTSALGLQAATNDLTSLLQQGLFDEEANHDLTSAIADYQSLATQFDRDRQVAATAIYRLGECYRKLSETNQAIGEYQRIIREFAEQKDLVTLSQQNLRGLGVATQTQFQQNLEKIVHGASTEAKTSTTASPAAEESERLRAQLLMVRKLQGTDLTNILQIAPSVLTDETLLNFINQYNQTDLDILRKRAENAANLHSNRFVDIAGVQALTDVRDGIGQKITERLAGLEQALTLELAATGNGETIGRQMQQFNLAEEIQNVEKQLELQQQQVNVGTLASSALLPTKQKLLELQQQQTTLNAGQATPSQPDSLDGEDKEIARIQEMLKNSPDLVNGPNGELAKAASSGELRVAAFLLDHGADINAEDRQQIPLVAAAANAQKSMVELLLERGANVNIRDESGSTALLAAARAGYQAVVEVLIAHKADVNEAYTSLNNKETPLHVAAEGGFASIVHLLLAAGANPNVENDRGRTPLSLAAANDSPDALKLLLAAKADANGGTLDAPLLVAVNKGSTASAELLLQAGASPDANGKVDWTIQDAGGRGQRYVGPFDPLRLAILLDDAPMVQLLLKHKANPNNAPGTVWAPIFDALSNTNILAALLGANANPNAIDNNGRPPLSYATEHDSPESVKMLLAAGANPNGGDYYRTSLSLAVQNGSSEKVNMLLAAKADPNATNVDAPLLYAVNLKDTVAAEMLLAAGANPNEKKKVDWWVTINGSQQDPASVTPLWLAVTTKQFPMVQLLLKYKADPNDQQTDGKSLLFSALDATNVLGTLLDAGADVESTSIDALQRTPLGMAASQNNVSAVQVLLKHGANPNASNRNGETVLHWAADGLADTNIVDLLLAAKANPNVRDSNGQTPLDELKSNRRRPPLSLASPKIRAAELAELLRRHGALDQLPDWQHITASRPSANVSGPIFSSGTNDGNKFTLLEMVAVTSQFLASSPKNPEEEGGSKTAARFFSENQSLPFPDLTNIRIHRPSADEKSVTNIKVDLEAGLVAGDCANNVALAWGDVVEVPEADHPLNETWPGFSDVELTNLQKCLTRQVEIVVKGQTNTVTLAPGISLGYPPTAPAMERSLEFERVRQGGGRLIFFTKKSFWLGPVLVQSKLILASSDLSQVAVTRHDPETGKISTWTVDCSGISENRYNAADVWLRDGDVVVVPEKP